MPQAQDFIDLDRYPIEDLSTQAARDLIDRCRNDLDAGAICALEGFIRGDRIGALANEAIRLSDEAYPNEKMRTPYSWMYNLDFPEDHPRRAMFRIKTASVLAHQITRSSAIRTIYEWDALTEFVRQVLGAATFYRSADPHLSLMLTSMPEGGELGWHFDTNDGVVSLLLNAADSGGEFECAPYIRSEEDENYDAVARLFRGEPGLSVKPRIEPGTFVLFKGRRSCHRVTRVGPTRSPRMIALFSYDEKPGMVFTRATQQNAMNGNNDPFYGRSKPRY